MSDAIRPTLFLCWSGHRSKQVAESFKEYFTRVFETAQPARELRVEMSETLIEKGAPWSAQLLGNLENAQAGIVCLTPENRGSAWLHFEGGAIASHRLMGQDGTAKAAASANKLFAFLFTMDNSQIEGPLSLFQATIYRRDYDRDRAELVRLTRAIVKRFEGCTGAEQDEEQLNGLMGRLRELQFLAFRESVPGLEGHARQVIQAIGDLNHVPGRVQALSAMLSVQKLLEDREREMEVVCAPSQLMFLERLIEVLSVACRGLERAIAEGSGKALEPLEEFTGKLRRILEVAVEPLVPVLDDAWRYAFYALHGRQEAYRKQKLLLVHPLESTLQRAELDAPQDSGMSPTAVPRGHLLSRNEKLRALRSFWVFDRVAAYIHYCEDVSRPAGEDLEETIRELTRAVLKEISLIEVSSDDDGRHQPDDLPLRFAVRALILKIKIGIGHGSYGPGDESPVLDKPRVRAVIESRIKGETGLSFEGIEELIASLRTLNDKIGSPSTVNLKAPLVSLCDDLERLIGNRFEPGPPEPPG